MGAFALPLNGLLAPTAEAAGAAGAAAGAGAGTAVTVGLLSNPVTAIAGAGLAVFSLVKGIFSAHHQKAVATEAGALNEAVPAVESSWKGILDYVNNGSLGPDQAKAALDSTIPAYESLVYDQYKVKRKSGNGPDYVEGVLKADLAKVESLLGGATSGSVDIPALPSHAGFAGSPEMTLTFNKPSGGAATATQAVSNTVSSVATATGVPVWAVWAAAVVLVLIVVRAIR